MTRSEIVNAVHLPRNIRLFRGQCQIFAERVEAYAERLIKRCERQRAELIEKLGEGAFQGTERNGFVTCPAEDALAEEKAAGPPESGLVWEDGDDCCLFLIHRDVRAIWLPHWRPAEDTNPLLWFINSDPPKEIGKRAYVYPGYGMAPQDQMLHDSVLLSIAHDYEPSLSTSEPHIFDGVPLRRYWCRDEFRQKVWNALMQEGGEDRLQRAWDRVNAQGSAEADEDEDVERVPFGFRPPQRENNPPEEPQYIFKNEGATWRIRYEGQETTVLDSKGIKYIHHLVKNKGKAIECLDIEKACYPPDTDGLRKVDPGEATELGLHTGEVDVERLADYDLETIKKAKEKLEQELDSEADPAKQVEIQERIDRLKGYLNKNKNIHGTIRPMGPVEDARNRVSKAINAAKRAIHDKNDTIGKHFRLTVKPSGTAFIYNPDRPIDWNLT